MGNLRQSSGTITSGLARNRLLRSLAVAQLAVVFLLTNGAVLLAGYFGYLAYLLARGAV